MQPRLLSGLAIAALLTAAGPESAGNAVTGVRFWTLGDTTRVVVETSKPFDYKRDRVQDPDRVFFDFAQTRVALARKGLTSIAVNDGRLKQIRVALTQPDVARVVFDLEPNVDYSASTLSNPPRLIVEFRAAEKKPAEVSTAAPAAPAPPVPVQTATAPAVAPETPKAAPARTEPLPQPAMAVVPPPDLPRSTPSQGRTPVTRPAPPKAAKLGDATSMTRVLGLKVGRIVLDPGHGGHDTGTLGPGGLLEKDLVLDVAQRLGALIEQRLGAEVTFTRTDDTFIALERRTEIANERKADLFLSIHANSSPVSTSSGVETYYLNFTNNRAAMEVAARENASSQKTVYELKDLLQRIALQDKMEESKQFAAQVQQSLYHASARANSRTRDRGVRTAPFVVLIGASMPSVLAEIGFVSNPRDEALMKKPEFRQKLAEGLYQGVARYASTLSQSQVARKSTASEGQ